MVRTSRILKNGPILRIPLCQFSSQPETRLSSSLWESSCTEFWPHAASFRCLIPRFDGAIHSLEWKEALWDKFV
ncbi:hypothetical protein, partial [uncultured Ruegeria sp.]|uniref:hypothetical protein n=1 Tax=uncultured Ruegeria sp. TaxID=259304 RepID=UPI002631A58F